MRIPAGDLKTAGWLVGILTLLCFLPVGTPRFDGAVTESLECRPVHRHRLDFRRDIHLTNQPTTTHHERNPPMTARTIGFNPWMPVADRRLEVQRSRKGTTS